MTAPAAVRQRHSVRYAVRRLSALLETEAVTEWRYGIPVAIAGLAAAWSAMAAMLPAAAPYLVFVETVTVATFIIGALAAAERQTGIRTALTVSPVRPAEYVAARALPLTGLTALAALPVLLAGRVSPGRLPSALAAVALTAAMLLAIALAVAIRRRTFVGFLTAAPWPLLPLLAVPLAVAMGLLGGAGWYVVPTTGALALLLDAVGPAATARAPAFPQLVLLGYLALWTSVAATIAAGAVRRPDARPAAPERRKARTYRARRREHGFELGPRPLSFVRADLRNIVRDSMLAPVALSPLLLGGALRFGYPPFEEWLALTQGTELAPYRPVVALLAIVLHVPLTAGIVGAVFVLDDLDSGVLGVVRVSPLGTARYLAYRLGMVTAASAGGLAVAVPLSGLVPASGWAAAVLAAPLAPVFTLAVLAIASGRVEGITAIKPLGIPMYLPIVAWWATGPATWLLAALPAFWVVRAWDGRALPPLLGGAVCIGVWLSLLARRVVRRL